MSDTFVLPDLDPAAVGQALAVGTVTIDTVTLAALLSFATAAPREMPPRFAELWALLETVDPPLVDESTALLKDWSHGSTFVDLMLLLARLRNPNPTTT